MRCFDKHIIILGSARSGTSWLSEIIGLQYRYRLLFEPEHEFNTPNGKLICDRYLTSKKTSNKIHSYLRKVFSNRVDCDWIAQLSNRQWKRHLWPFVPKKIIVKFVRCNLAVEYLHTEFKIPILFVVRNPYDVIASQCRVKFSWLYDLSWFTNQEELCELINSTYGYNLRKEKRLTDFEKLCLRWCIENSIPLLYNHRNFKVVKYETIKNDIGVFLQLCENFRLKPLSNINTAFYKPSSKTHKKSDIITGETANRAFSSEDYKVLNTFLDIFKIDLYEREH